MEPLRLKDIRLLLEFLHGCYAAPDLDGFAACVLGDIPKVIPSEIVSFERMQSFPHDIHYLVAPAESGPPDGEQILSRHMHEHPFVPHYRRARDASAVKISDFLTKRQFHRLGLYNEFFRRAHPSVEDLIHVHLDGRLPSGVFVSLCRHSRDFNERDRLVLNLLRPHLRQAYGNAEALTRLKEELALARQTIEELEHGVIVLGPRGQVRLVTARAGKWVEEYFGTPVHAGRRLQGALDEWVKRQLDALGRIEGYPPPLAPLVIEREEKRLTVRLVPREGDTLILLEEQLLGIRPQALTALGLSRRETEVLALVAEGKTNVEVGMLLEMRAKTVEKHLERIFEKLGVETRTAAARRAFDFLSAL